MFETIVSLVGCLVYLTFVFRVNLNPRAEALWTRLWLCFLAFCLVAMIVLEFIL